MKNPLPSSLTTVNRRPLVIILCFLVTPLEAQPTPGKIGFANIEYIFGQLPEAKQIESDLKSLQGQLKNQLDTKAAALQKKYDAYTANVKTMTEAAKLETEEELQILENDYQKLREDAVKTLENKHAQLMRPLMNKIEKAIEAVALENSFTMIFNLESEGQFVVLYGDESLNVSDLVVTRLKANK